ncbi:PaaI family thioesterase [Aerococcaceae bacterium DSM 111022]|nr:PaaI family thioesterase [Aerococcaceae bacterium DSM 111022]
MELYTRIKESFDKQKFMHHIGAKLESVEEGKVSISIENKGQLSQQEGFMHAGATTTIADSAAGYAALTMMPEDREVVSVEFKVNLLRPAAGTKFMANAWVVKPGRQLTVVEAEVVDLDSGKLVAKFQGTMFSVSSGEAE